METGKVGSGNGDIIRDMPDQDKVLEKLLKRQEELELKALDRHEAKDKTQLLAAATKAIEERSTRRTPDYYKPLSDRKIIRDAKSDDIQQLRQKLNEEIQSFALARLKQVPESKEPEGLKGRVTRRTDESEEA